MNPADPIDPNEDLDDDLETETEAEAEAESEPEPAYDPGEFDEFLGRVTTKTSSGRKPAPLRRRTATVKIDPALCLPDTFHSKFKLTLVSLNSNDEKKALQAGTDGQTVAFAMTKMAIKKFNGRPLQRHHVDLIWEALGTSGRSAVTNVFMAHCTGANDKALGKSLASVEIG